MIPRLLCSGFSGLRKPKILMYSEVIIFNKEQKICQETAVKTGISKNYAVL
jgi:hypothetical protein